jgi:hypothetical protein
MTNIYRPGSKLFEVYAVFLSKGIEAAVAHGVTIGLAQSTLKIQAKRKNWGGGGVQVQVEGNAIKAARKSRTIESSKPRFRLSKKKDARQFIVITAGEQQSVCRWVDTGEDQCMSNSWMLPA